MPHIPLTKRLSAAAGALALAAAGVALAAAPAHAIGDDTTIKATVVTLPPGAARGALAICPAGRRVVGGGVGTTAAAVPRRAVRVSGPLDATGTTANTDDGDIALSWYAYLRNPAGATRTFKVFALCSATSDATIEASTFTVGPWNGDPVTGVPHRGLYALCPAGKRAVGGGIGTLAAVPQSTIRASGPLDETGLTRNTTNGDVARFWYAAAANPSAVSARFKTFALCSATSNATVYETAFTPSDAISTSKFRTCPAGRRITGGGVGFDDGNADIDVSGPLDATGSTSTTIDGDIANHWYATVEGASWMRAHVYAICAS